MKHEELDRLLSASQERKERSWGKILSYLKRQFDAIAMEELAKAGYADFKIGYMALLMNIHPQGITNNELAKKARITKQGMSKIVKELIRNGYIETEEHGSDKRSAVIVLTKKGKELVVKARHRVFEMEEEYGALLGAKKFEDLKESLIRIISYNDERFGAPVI